MKERVFKKLPAIHQTDVLDKFFKNTIDQWFDEENVIRSAGFVGRRIPGVHNFESDFYFPEIDQTRENYQFEPALTTKDVDTAEITNILFYDDVLKILSVEGSNISNHDRLFKSKAYSWAPPIDVDKFINYENYYWYDNGPTKIEITAPLSAPIVITADVIGQASFTSSNGIKFSNGMKVEFSGANITPITHLNKEFIVEGVGTSINLIDVSSDDFNHTLPYMIPGSETEHLWDVDFWDEVVWAATIVGEATPLEQRIDYITIKRGAINQNAWSRTNGWYHKDVLLQVTGTVTGATFTEETLHPWDLETAAHDTTEWDSSLDVLSETFSLDNLRQAKRPIIEFNSDLELYKYGTEGIGSVSVASMINYDDVHNAVNPIVDEYTLKTGDTLIFLNDNLLNFNLWDIDAWDPGSHPAGIQVPPGPFADMPAGASGDWDLTMGSGASSFGTIFTVTIAAGTGVCTLSSTTVVKPDQKVFTKKGRYYLGREFYWNGSTWTLSQLKDKQNDEPLFQLYDADTNKLDDISVYSSNTFAGSKLFSYKTAASGTADTYVGKALQYKEFGQTADIVFTNNFEDTIDNVIGYKYANQYNLSGTGSDPKDKMISTFVNGWNPTNTYSKQLVSETFIAISTGAQVYELNVTPVVNAGIADVIVTVDGVVVTQSTATTPYDYGIVNRVLTFTTNKVITEKQVIEVRANTNTFVNINDNHYYEIPDNLEANPDNLDISEATASELQDHFSSIIKSQVGIIGNETGTNNYRDTAKDSSKGTKILQHESSLLPMMVLMSKNNDFNITSSIRYNQKEYETFKGKFLQRAEFYGTQIDTSVISEVVDTVLDNMYSYRSNLKIFTETHPFAYGTNYKEQIVYPDFNITYIDIEETVTSTNIDNREKIVYVYFTKPADRADGKEHTLLLKDIDYSIKVTLNEVGTSVTRITFTDTIERDSSVEIRVYENIQNSFVPLTPSMVGMHSVYLPRVLYDDTYVGVDQKFIQGHDGSRTLAFGDFRDDALLELEKRIYNAIPDTFIQDYLPAVNYFKVAPGKFRTSDYSRFEFSRILEPIVQRWCVEHDVDLLTHRTYDESLPFTWNYSKELDKDGETVAGNWRGIYLDYYDTVNPHSRPWEMLGFGMQPLWWIAQYGTDYSNINTALWSDLENGIIRNGPRENYTDSSYLTDNPFRRVGLSNVIPVDHLGKLLDPVEAGIFGTPSTKIIAGEYSVPYIVDRHLPWQFGDVGPAEFSARINVIWPWVLNKLLYLTRPTEYCTKAWDTLNFNRPKADKKQVVFKDTNKRKQLKDFKFYSDTSIVCGYQAWIYSHLLSESRTYTDVISNVFKASGVALGYKAGGFISNNFTAIADSYSTTRTTNSIFIPEENKTVLLYNGFSEGLRVYSGVKVTITETGYAVSGFDSFNSNFRIIPCINTGTSDTVEVGNVRVQKYHNHYDVLAEVAYGTEYQTVQDVYTFLIGYGKYLESMGFVFDEYDRDILDVLDWEYAAKEFLFWAQMSTWEIGAFLSLSPAAAKIKLNITNIGRIDTMKEIINATYSIVDKDSRAIEIQNLDIKRENDYFSVSEVNGLGIFGLKLNPYRSEHAIIFDNKTEFNDLIYDPLLRLRQARIKLNLVKSGNWTGTLEAPGYIVRGNTIIPNFDTTANDYRKLFRVHDVPVTETLLDSARHLVGYQQRDYLDNITENENVSFEFFQGMLRQKGNMQSINKLLRNTRLDNNSMTVFEEYAFKIGEFGATSLSTKNEIQIKANDVRIQNPLIEFTYEDNSIDVLIDDLIQINHANDTRWVSKPSFPETQVWPMLAIGHTEDTWLPTAGYVHNDDVTYRAFNIKALAALNTVSQAITEPIVGSIVHVAKTDNEEFGVYKLIETDLLVQHSQLLSTGKTEINVVDEVIPIVTGITPTITAKVGDEINVSLDGGTPTIITLSTSSFESEPPVMTVDVSNTELIHRNESIFISTPNGEKEVVFSSVPDGPVTIIGQVFNPTITATDTIKIDNTTITFTAGDTLSVSGTGATYTGGIVGNININVPNVTASSHNGYLRLTTTNTTLIFDTESIESTIIDSDVGIQSDLYYNDLSPTEIYNDMVTAGIADIFITLDEVNKEITLTGQYAKKIQVRKGIGEAFRALHFTDELNREVSSVDNRVVSIDNVITDINAAITDEDFLASTDVNGNLQIVYNGSSLHVAGSALAGIGLQAQTSSLVSSPVQSHPFKNNDVVVLINVTDADNTVIDIAGGYVVEEQIVYVNKAVDIASGVVTITDLVTNNVTTLTNVSSIPVYDIVSADRDFIKDFILNIVLPMSPNEIQVGDSDTANSILPAFTAADIRNYTTNNIGPYTTIVSGAGNVVISTVSGGSFVSGSFTVSMVVKKKGIFVIDDFVKEVANASNKIQLWHPRRFTTKTEAFDNVRLNKTSYSTLDLVWIDSTPNGWLVSKLVDLKNHYGISAFAIATGGTNYTPADINKTFTIDTFIVDTKIQPVGKITGIKYGVGSSTVQNGGLGYTSPPTVSFSGGGELITAEAKAILQTVITGITIDSSGSGYKALPGVEIYESPIYNGKIWNVEHNLNQKYVNLEIIDHLHNTFKSVYSPPTITYVDVNNVTIEWGSTKVGYIDVIKSEFVSSLYGTETVPLGVWAVQHNLGQQYVNVDIIYSNDQDAISHLDYPLIEYTDTNNLIILFPQGVKKSGRVAVTFSDSYVPGAPAVVGQTHTQTVAAKTWTFNHNMGKRYVNVDVALLGSDIDLLDLGNWAVTQHNLNQQYVNVSLIDAEDNLVNTIYEPASVEFSGVNTVEIRGGSVAINKVNVVKSKFVSSLQSAANTWTVTHSLNKAIANVDIIYSDGTLASSKHDYPLIEYTDNNNIKVIFPTSVTKTGYAVVTHNDVNGASPGFGYEGTYTSSTTWTVNHNLGKKYVNVDIAVLGSSIQSGDYSEAINAAKYYNIKGMYDFPDVKFLDNNNLTITFRTATAGKVVVSGGTTFATTADTKYYNIKGNYDFPVINHVSANQMTVTWDTPRVGKVIASAGKGIKDDDSVVAVHMELGDCGTVKAITPNAAGTNYQVGDVLTLTSGTGLAGTGTVATVNGSGGVTSITTLYSGDYTVLPTVTGHAPEVSPSGGGRAGLTLDLLFKVKALAITNSDSFQVTPDIKITAPAYGGGGGCTPTQATATAVISGVVTSLQMLASGHYTSVPTITLTGGGGVLAAAVANLAGPVESVSVAVQGDITYLPAVSTSIPIVNVDTIVGTGLTVDATFTDITSFDTWFETHRAEEQRINTALFNAATLYDTTAKTIDAQPTLLDLPKGIISGLADTEISYKLHRNPARYNVTDDASSLVNEDFLWDSKQEGQLWWDISTVKFYNAEQGDNRYRRKYWNQMFPGSSIDIYEWVKSTVTPTNYEGSGTVKSKTQYSQVEEWDLAISKFVTNYYFWVKNKTTIPRVEWRSRSANDVTTYISTLANTQWYAPISNHYERVDDIIIAIGGAAQTISATGVDPSLITTVRLNGIKVTYTNGVIASDGTITSITLTTTAVFNDLLQVTYKKPGGAMVVNNIDHLITVEDSRLQLEYKTKTTEANVHKQWILLRKDDVRSTIPSYFLNKMTDSLVGYDKAGVAIPDTAILHEDKRYGTLYRPRQTWFKDVKLARKNFVELMNTILTILTVNDNKTGWDVDVYNNQFITYVDWWDIGYSTATVVKYTVDTIAKRKLLTGLLNGDIVKVKNDGTNRWRVYKYVLATETFLKIGAEKQTVNFKTTTYTDTFTLAQSTDFRAIIEAIFKNVFTVEWLVKQNEVFFGMTSYVLSEQSEVDWIFKSSYLNVSSAEDNVKQIPNFKVELLPHVQEYINEVKPYTSKVREYRGVKNLQLETIKSHITDFDNPPYYNSDTGKVQTLLTGVHPSYDLVLQTGIYKDYLDNHTDTNLLRSSKVSLLFDRVDKNIAQTKTYLTTGNVGVDSRTVHHAIQYTDAQRLRSAIKDLNTRTSVGDLINGNPSDHASQRIAKYSTAANVYLTSLATMKLTTDDNIKNHPIIVANTMYTLTSITYDQLLSTDVYYTGLALTIAEAIARYDHDNNAVLRTGQNADFDSIVDGVDLAPGTATDAQITINNFLNDYKVTQTLLTELISNAFYDKAKIELEDGARFDTTMFENDIPEPQEWGWDSQAWDHTIVENSEETTLVTWDEGESLPVIFSEFPNFAIEPFPAYGNDRIGWHTYNVTTKSGIERVDYTEKFIYVTASGIPDHNSNWYDATWLHLDENNPNIISHQNARWNIPGSITVLGTADKESKPTGPVAVLRNGVTLYSSATLDSHGNDGVWNYDALYTAGGTTGYGPGVEKFTWRHRDQYGGAIDLHGVYHYYANPTAIYDDNPHEHSPLLGYAFDGVPIYGPQGYANTSYTGDGTTTIFAGPLGPEYATALMVDGNIKIVVDGVRQVVATDYTFTGAAGVEKGQITFGTAPALDSVITFTVTSKIQKMRSSYRLKTGTRVAIGSEPSVPTGSYDGTYYQDYEYVAGLGDLDEYNGRIAYTPETPSGVYAYYVTIDEENLPVFPYVIGTKYYGKPETSNYNMTAGTVVEPSFIITDPDHKGIPNVSIERQDRDSKGHVRPTVEQWPDELIPISSKEGLQITVQTNNHYTLGSVTDWLSFRIYYDADGETKYYALPNDAKTTASTAITKLDTEISVTDVKVLPEPYMNSLGTGYTVPGVVFIGSERVEYLDIDIANNKLLHCRRGTGTTSVQDHAISTAIFSGDINNILTYDTETTWSPHATNGLNASTSEQAVFFKNRSGNALA